MDQPAIKDEAKEAPNSAPEVNWSTAVLAGPEVAKKACKPDKHSAPSELVKPEDVVLSFDQPTCNNKGGGLQSLTDGSQIVPMYTGVDGSGKPIDKVDNSAARDSQTVQDSQSPSSDVLQQAVDKRLGQSLDVANRRLGCTTAVSQVLSEIDPEIKVSNNNSAFARDLEAHGYEKVALADIKPGDVIIGKRPDGMPGHSAIYMGDGKVFNNNSNSQQMQIDGVEKFAQGMHDQNGRWNKNGFSETVVYRKAEPKIASDDQAVKPISDMSVTFTPNAGLEQIKPIPPILDIRSLQLGTESSVRFQPGVNLGAPIQHHWDSHPLRAANNRQFAFTPNAGLDQIKPIRPILDFSSVQLGSENSFNFQPGDNLVEPIQQQGDRQPDQAVQPLRPVQPQGDSQPAPQPVSQPAAAEAVASPSDKERRAAAETPIELGPEDFQLPGV